jgi:hypothetical protein
MAKSSKSIGARHRRCPNECRPVRATVIAERDHDHKVTRRLWCPSCTSSWVQHRYI